MDGFPNSIHPTCWGGISPPNHYIIAGLDGPELHPAIAKRVTELDLRMNFKVPLDELLRTLPTQAIQASRKGGFQH